MMKRIRYSGLLAVGAMFVSAEAAGHGCPAPSLDVVTTYPVGVSPESITADDAGNLYYSTGNTVHQRTPGGVDTVYATLPIPVFALGVKVGRDHCVYNTSVSLDPSVAGAFVWRTCVAGTTAQVFATLDPAGGPNDLAFDDDGDLFVTDPFLGKIWKVTPSGSASVWLSHSILDGNSANPYLTFHAIGVDGIAFSRNDRALFVTNLDYGKIIRIPIRFNGTAGAPSVWASDPRLQGADGIAFDAVGNLYAAINRQDSLVRISPFGHISVLATGAPLDGASSVVFGTRPGERDVLYVSSSAFLRTNGIQPGTPAPALLKIDTPFRGLPLP